LRGREIAVYEVRRPGYGAVGDRRDLVATASFGAPKPQLAHQTLDGAASDPMTFTVQLPPDLVGTVDLEVLVPDALDLLAQRPVTTQTWR